MASVPTWIVGRDREGVRLHRGDWQLGRRDGGQRNDEHKCGRRIDYCGGWGRRQRWREEGGGRGGRTGKSNLAWSRVPGSKWRGGLWAAKEASLCLSGSEADWDDKQGPNTPPDRSSLEASRPIWHIYCQMGQVSERSPKLGSSSTADREPMKTKHREANKDHGM